MDAEGNDTGNLSLSTGSLTTTDLNNHSYSSNQSFGVNTSVGISEAANPADPNQSDTNLALNSSNYSYQNESSQSLDKSLATIGEGSVSVNGEETSSEGVNRDVAQVNKEIYDVDRQQGNIDLTVDHRLLSEEGREQIAKDAEVVQETAGDVAYSLGADDVTQFLYDIDDANISAALKDNAEETLDLLIASDVDPAVAKALLTNPEFYNTVASILANGDALGEGNQRLSDTSDNTGQSSYTPGQPLTITITKGLSPTPVQNVLLGLKDVEGFVSGLPAEEAQAAMIGLGLLTGGVVKTAVDVAKDTVVDTALGAQIRDLQQNVAKVVAAGATGVDVGTHEGLIEVESGNGFSTDLQTGSEFGLEVIGLGTGIGVAKKVEGKGVEGSNNSSHSRVLGENGPTIPSLTLWNSKGKDKGRIDVENANPGQRPG
ncbi:hypothetical protein CWI84_09545 [Idiomarina tyrosinivorans]|uniref:Uncharacterized protein n=1 Tax=Idiomarina tyrosinivorans TaxID=1445662 RepID=A0A432ZPP0_9GAMM|nr:hypothetical protein [Idiomarina tyrosinivorans]RUO79860.1 hypothetical protein CWI84_09545 [Idiomarina tyrosinivorans]